VLRQPTTSATAGKPFAFPAVWSVLLLIAAVLLAYLPALRGGFIFDDNVFLTANPLIQAPDGLRRLWFTRQAADYWPVTSSTLWLEWRLWGLNAAGYHVTNVILHAVEVLLFWALLRRLKVPGAFFAALVFALHPVNAETVAWITERKNLMAMLFFLLALFWFAGGRRWEYWLSLLAFTLAMLSKGSVVVLPVVLLGLICWDRRPEWRDLLRLAPFFAVAGALAFYEAQFSTVLAPAYMQPLNFLGRVLRAGAIIGFYLGKVLWPAGLCFDYGQWKVQPADFRWWLPLAAVLALTAALWIGRRRSGIRAALFGWGYFCVALGPALGFVEVGFMRYSPVSNVYAHLALLGVAALAGAGGARLVAIARGMGHPSPSLLFGAAASIAVGFAVLTWKQSRIYADAVTLYRDTVAQNPSSWPSQVNLGVLLYTAGNGTEAVTHLEKAVQLRPDYPEAHNDLGNAYLQTRRLADARREYEQALGLSPDYAEAHNNLGVVLAESGRVTEAIAQFEEALRIDPDFRNARQNLDHARSLEQSAPPFR